MKFSKQTFIIGCALFSLFFGAGNLILPPYLGYNAGDDWLWVSLGFAVSAVVIPIMAIYGHAKIQGTMMDFAGKVSPVFALVYSLFVYIISSTLPAPRTASVTYEMAIQPYFEMSSVTLSSIYFALVLLFVLNRSTILTIIGKYLTPLLVLILFAVIIIGLTSDTEAVRSSIFDNTFTAGILEGYQTFDAIGGVVVGGVLVISLSFGNKYNYAQKKSIIARSGLLAGLGLFVIYGGLIALGSAFSGTMEIDNRTQLLNDLSIHALKKTGTAFLAVLVSLACFTTAVGIVTGTADFVKGLFKQSRMAYIATAVLASILGVLMGQMDVHYIIDIALPALMFIYPITIVLILLNITPDRWASKLVFRVVVLTTFLFSIPDFLGFIIAEEKLGTIKDLIPLSQHHMGWILPAVAVFLLANLLLFTRRRG